MDELPANQSLAPVCIFVYNRLATTRKTINALRRNKLANETDLFVYSDGGRDAKSWKQILRLRKYLKTIIGFKSVCVVERQANYYIERNVIEGVTEVINKFGSVIVLEDDVITGKYFLSFMNNALKYYNGIKSVMHITGYTFVNLEDLGETILWKYSEGSGWATWKDRWDKFKYYQLKNEALSDLNRDDINQLQLDGVFKCIKTLDLTPIPWDICWYIAIIKNNGLCLTPTRSLVRNIGLYSGTHFSGSRLLGKSFYETTASDLNITKMTPIIESNSEAMNRLKEFYSNAHFKYNYFGIFINKCFSLWRKMRNALFETK